MKDNNGPMFIYTKDWTIDDTRSGRWWFIPGDDDDGGGGGGGGSGGGEEVIDASTRNLG